MTDNRIVRGDRVLRYNFQERVLHWVSAVTYIYLLLTGLAFWSPWLFWITAVLGGGWAARTFHPIAGLIFCGSVLYMYVIWKQDMRITAIDRAWGKAMGTYIRNEEEEESPPTAPPSWQKLPPVDRFNLGQKYMFWTMFYGGLVLFLTGMVLWFTEYLPWSLRFLRYISVFLHPVAFLFTLAAFIVHVYMGTAVVQGGFTSVIRGEVSKEWARHHHRLWLERVTGEDASPK